MEDNVLHGTGKRAAVNGYRVGGKTATGEKTNNQGLYDKDKLVSSFLSIFLFLLIVLAMDRLPHSS